MDFLQKGVSSTIFSKYAFKRNFLQERSQERFHQRKVLSAISSKKGSKWISSKGSKCDFLQKGSQVRFSQSRHLRAAFSKKALKSDFFFPKHGFKCNFFQEGSQVDFFKGF